MTETTLWLTLAIAGLMTFALRLSFIAGIGQQQVPPLAARALRFVPIAVLTALIVPDLIQPSDAAGWPLAYDRLLAGGVAIFLAGWTRNILITLAGGMVALLLAQALLHGGG